MMGAGACYGGILVRVDAVRWDARRQWHPKRFEKGSLGGFVGQT